MNRRTKKYAYIALLLASTALLFLTFTFVLPPVLHIFTTIYWLQTLHAFIFMHIAFAAMLARIGLDATPSLAKNWNALVSRATVLVTPNGPVDGGDFGPQTTAGGTIGQTGGTASTSNGFGEAVTYATANNLMITIQGAYTTNLTTFLANNTFIFFQDCTITLGAVNKNAFTGTGLDNLTFVGNLTINGGSANGNSGNGFILPACTNVMFDWACKVSSFGHAPIKYCILGQSSGGTGGSNFTLRGKTVTTDSPVVRLLDYSYVDVSGVESINGGVTANLADSFVRTINDGLTGGILRDHCIHDCQFDGGGLQATAPISVSPNSGQPTIDGVQIHDILVRNTMAVPKVSNTADGIDVGSCTRVTIADVVGDLCNSLVSTTSTGAKLSGIVAFTCNAGGIAIGDPTFQHINISDIVVSDCVAVNCGQGFSNGAASGIMVTSTAALTTDRVSFFNCRSRDTTGTAQKYGLGFVANGTITNVRYTGGELNGFTQAILNPSGLNLTVYDVKGVSDFGVIAATFNNTNNTMGFLQTTAAAVAAPTVAKAYTVSPIPLLMYALSASGTITITDAGSTAIVTGLAIASLTLFELEPGWIVTFNTAAPSTLTIIAKG